MKLRVFLLFLFIVFQSCNKITFSKQERIQQLDTIIDFSSVDTYPSFPKCDSIVTKEAKADCFRKSLHKAIHSELQYYTFMVKDTINEVVMLQIKIDSTGVFSLQQLDYSEKIQQELPDLDSVFKVALQKLPRIFPAIKRGIPVSSTYQIPIKIKL